MSECRLVIITALKEELAAVQAALPDAAGAGVVLLRGGVGWDSAARAAREALAAHQAAALCSTGFCGALADGVAVGDVLVPEAICAELPDPSVFPLDDTGDSTEGARDKDSASAAIAVKSEIASAVGGGGVKTHRGKLLTVRAAVTECSRKRELGTSCAALGVDMESYAVAAAARAAGVEFFGLRTVSDSVDDALPPEVAGFLDANGDVRVTNVARFAMSGTRNMKTLWELKARSDKARASLTAVWRASWPALQRLLQSQKVKGQKSKGQQ